MRYQQQLCHRDGIKWNGMPFGWHTLLDLCHPGEMSHLTKSPMWLSVASYVIRMRYHLHAVHSTAWWTRFEGLWKGPVSPFQLADKSPMITDQHTAGDSASQISQLNKLSPWLTLSTQDITTSFWHYNKWFCFLSNQIMGLYHFSNPWRIKSVHLWWKINLDYLRYRLKERIKLLGMLDWP